MKCRQAKKLLSPYIDDELGDAERAALEKHLACCDACRSEVEELRRISESLKGIYREVKAPPDLVDKIMKRIQELEEGKSSRLVGDNSSWYQGWWLKAAAVAALAAGVGLGALQYSRTHTGSAAWPGYQAGTEVTAEKDGVTLPTTQVSDAEKVQVANKDEHNVRAERLPGQGEFSKLEKPQIPQVRTSAAVEKPKNAIREQELGEESKVASQLATSQVTVPYEPKAFLSKNRHVRVTWLKVGVDDLVAAKIGVAAAAAGAGANGLGELWVYQDKEVILKVTLPSTSTGEFLDRVASLGKVLERRQEVEDITGEFNNKVLEYQVLAAKKDEESRVAAEALERHLEELDTQTLEAGNEVVNVWLKLR